MEDLIFEDTHCNFHEDILFYNYILILKHYGEKLYFPECSNLRNKLIKSVPKMF